MDAKELARDIRRWGGELGFQAVGIADADLAAAGTRLAAWLEKGWHGEMDYMARHAALRAQPQALVPETLRVVSCRMNYSATLEDEARALADGERAYLARYARGRDYHKVLRARLQRLCDRIEAVTEGFSYRVFCDSAPVMEVELAVKAGIGWRGKNTLLLARDAGSYFFLGEIYTSLPLPVDSPAEEHCGTCTACLAACPTGAIRAPYELDARRCISYLTIELQGAIPEELRPLVGNRVYGCDDCQIACPWNSFAQAAGEPDFRVRNGLDAASLVELFAWNEREFEERLRGSAIRRIGYERWLRNLAVGLGNAPSIAAVVSALRARADHPSALVREHVAWALSRHERLAA
ncbi:MAG: tRNA epoxyqueuosine(34) reductase QueG [Betaproteobacteria bacterium RIFCSPLOWO2_02_FULL_66_14]|nr:MAG: tRNA epoxyqueuosine(34) reductase QueG [Betaproteobacteria bacterium RIFCSPLOWO2_02_FULL_66_14]